MYRESLFAGEEQEGQHVEVWYGRRREGRAPEGRGRVMCGRKCVIEVGARLGNTVIEVLVKGYG